MLEAIRIARVLGIIVMIVTYAVLVHHVNTSGQSSNIGGILALLPMFLLVITLVLKTSSRLVGISLLLSFCIASWFAWTLVRQHTGIIFWMQDIALMSVLLVTFGWTLQRDHKPLCVHFAEMINGGALPAEHERYAHKVTVAWVAFFVMMIIASTLLFFLAPLAMWSFFVNFLTLPLVALMFIVEFMVRRHILADFPTGHILDAVRAYLNNSARTN